MSIKNKKRKEIKIMEVLWTARKRWAIGVPWTFTVYSLREDKLLIDKGFLSKVQEEIMLYRVLDLTLRRGLFQRMFKLGSITVKSSDKSCPEIVIKNIKNSQEIKEQISELVDKARDKKRVMSRELINGVHDDDGDDMNDWM